MKAGRNDPCPCGSGKKYKKCCLDKDREVSLKESALQPPPTPAALAPHHTASRTDPNPSPTGATLGHPVAPPRPRDPVIERTEKLWEEFESQAPDERIAVFLRALDDTEATDEDLAFEMLDRIHTDAVQQDKRARFAECLDALRARRPELFTANAPYYVSWSVMDALAEGRLDAVSALAPDLAASAGQNIDVFHWAQDALAYHGLLDVFVQVLRAAWPLVKNSTDILAWAIGEFAENGVIHEIFHYLEHTSAPDPDDAGLRDRIEYFVESPREGYLREVISDLTGTSGRAWQASDFTLRPKQKSRRDEWGDEEQEPPRDPGVDNLRRLTAEFVGYLHREEGVPFPRGELVREELFRYFLRRHDGDLDPQPSMMEMARNPRAKRPKPPAPAHPLCPERVTLEVCLGQLVDMFALRYHRAAALFQAVPAWLRFLQSRGLIDAATGNAVIERLRPLHAQLLPLWEQYTDDPALYRQEQAWPDRP